jgi:hypothetical protein
VFILPLRPPATVLDLLGNTTRAVIAPAPPSLRNSLARSTQVVADLASNSANLPTTLVLTMTLSLAMTTRTTTRTGEKKKMKKMKIFVKFLFIYQPPPPSSPPAVGPSLPQPSHIL